MLDARVIRRVVLCFALILPALVSGCATIDEHVSFDLASQPVVYRDQWARRDAPMVYVHPVEKTDMELTALFMPFRVTQKISEPEMIGYTQARVVWQTWLSKRLFSIMEFDGDHGPFRRDIAVNLAREKGADLAIGGFVTYYYAGGSEADSQVALQIEIYDAASGQLVWSMAQSALMPARTVNDYIIFATETRSPSDPMFALAKTIAEDTGNVVAKWVPASETATKPVGLLDRLKNLGKKEPPLQPVHPSF
ncbi:DUF4136 domain-containing protein [Desulfovibrio sp. OttesenSCG-928-O18]|nr:DUF4136 domain-containing protein [Desulfovibrio sp. OttesenSCG-928-O18]